MDKPKRVGKKKDLPPGASPISGVPPPLQYSWKPGQSGNPTGRPPSYLTLTSRLKARFGVKAPAAIAAQYFPGDFKDKTWLDVYVEAGLYHATDKARFDPAIYKEIFARIDGRLPEFPIPEPGAGDNDPVEAGVQSNVPAADAYKMAVGLLREMIRRGVFPAQVFIGAGDNGGKNGKE